MEENLSETSRLLDVSEDRFDDVLAQPVSTSMAALPASGAHGTNKPATFAAAARTAGAACRDVAADRAFDQAGEICLRAEPGVSGDLVRHSARVYGGGIEQRQQGILIG
jgi:hypothetical protein